jgi:hypothetical protein
MARNALLCVSSLFTTVDRTFRCQDVAKRNDVVLVLAWVMMLRDVM